MGAAAEANMEQVKSTLSGLTVGRAMLSDFQVLSLDDPLSRAIELTLAGSQTQFPVLENGVIPNYAPKANEKKGSQ